MQNFVQLVLTGLCYEINVFVIHTEIMVFVIIIITVMQVVIQSERVKNYEP